MRFLKYSILLFLVCAFILFLKLTVFYPSKQNAIVWNGTTTEKIIDLPTAPYDCKILVAVVGKNVNFCKLTINRPMVIGKPNVMGDFNTFTNTIRVTKETSNDSIVHEFIHYAITCEKKTKDNEMCVRSAQKMLLELNLIKN